jgi:N-acetylglucosamine malate deacetylase 1
MNELNMDVCELDVLVIAPHPDDAELGMAGAILHMLAHGQRVGILDLTDGEPTPHGSLEIRAAETTAASSALGITWRGNLDLPNRSLQPTLEAREKLASVIRLAKPRWLFAPYWVDAHPDHVAATELVEAARFWAKLSNTNMPGAPHHPERIYNYYCVHLKMVPQPAFILDISEYWPIKRKSIECYQSQFITGRETMVPTFIDRLEEQAGVWGQAIGVRFGEPFTCREPIGINAFSALV